MGNVALPELNVEPGESLWVGVPAKHHHLLPPPRQLTHNARAHKSRSARDENAHALMMRGAMALHKSPAPSCHTSLMASETLTDAGTRNGWLRLPDTDLLRQCREERYKSSGPGGQHRNKVETAVRLHHSRSGMSAQGEETRSQDQNRRHALSRLRHKIAFAVRSPFDLEAPHIPPEFIAQRGRRGSFAVNSKNPSFPLIAATALDALAAADNVYATAAHALGVTTSQLRKFLQSDRELWRAVSEAAS